MIYVMGCRCIWSDVSERTPRSLSQLSEKDRKTEKNI